MRGCLLFKVVLFLIFSSGQIFRSELLFLETFLCLFLFFFTVGQAEMTRELVQQFACHIQVFNKN